MTILTEKEKDFLRQHKRDIIKSDISAIFSDAENFGNREKLLKILSELYDVKLEDDKDLLKAMTKEGLTFGFTLDKKFCRVIGWNGNSIPERIEIPSEYNGSIVNGLDEKAFYNKPINEIVLPDTITYFGESVFSRTNITTIQIPSKVTFLSFGLFKGCKNLKDVYVSNNLQEIAEDTFEGCNNKDLILHFGGTKEEFLKVDLFCFFEWNLKYFPQTIECVDGTLTIQEVFDNKKPEKTIAEITL